MPDWRWPRLPIDLSRLHCWLAGHDDTRQSERLPDGGTRIYVRCLRCGRASTGIPLPPDPYTARRHQFCEELHRQGKVLDDLRIEDR